MENSKSNIFLHLILCLVSSILIIVKLFFVFSLTYFLIILILYLLIFCAVVFIKPKTYQYHIFCNIIFLLIVLFIPNAIYSTRSPINIPNTTGVNKPPPFINPKPFSIINDTDYLNAKKYFYNQDYAEAIPFFENVEKDSNNIKPDELTILYDYLGKLYFHLKNNEMALMYLQKSEKIKTDKLSDTDSIELAENYLFLSSVSYRKKEFSAAIDYANKSLSIKEKKLDKNDTQIGDLYFFRAWSELYNNQSDKAMNDSNYANEIYKKYNSQYCLDKIERIKILQKNISKRKKNKIFKKKGK